MLLPDNDDISIGPPFSDREQRCLKGDLVMKALFAQFLVPCIVVLLGGLTNVSPSRADYLTGSGCSISNVGYLADLAKEYEKRTGMKVMVRGGGSVVGLTDLRSGKVDFAASCKENDASMDDFESIQVAWDALVFIVHTANPVDSLSLKEAKSIFEGKADNWRQLNGGDIPVKLFISRAPQNLSGVEESTRRLVLGGKEPVAAPYVTFLPSTAVVEQMVEDSRGGFAASGFSSARKRNVKILNLDGVAPTKENIASAKYPLKRPLFLVIRKNPKLEVKKFVAFILGKEGQELIGSYGIVSLQDMQ